MQIISATFAVGLNRSCFNKDYDVPRNAHHFSNLRLEKSLFRTKFYKAVFRNKFVLYSRSVRL